LTRIAKPSDTYDAVPQLRSIHASKIRIVASQRELR
jgi:hypothetical protein